MSIEHVPAAVIEAANLAYKSALREGASGDAAAADFAKTTWNARGKADVGLVDEKLCEMRQQGGVAPAWIIKVIEWLRELNVKP